MMELYHTNDDFKTYIDKLCAKHKLSLEQALATRMAASYAEYLLGREKGKDENRPDRC